VHRAAELAPAALLDLMLAADALRRPERFEQLLRVCAADRQSSPGSSPASCPAARLTAALNVVRSVDAGAVVSGRPGARDVPRRIRAARLKALRNWMKTS
jgi:tRNA nucleotidyltransferase (CCA-adding enzyme)